MLEEPARATTRFAEPSASRGSQRIFGDMPLIRAQISTFLALRTSALRVRNKVRDYMRRKHTEFRVHITRTFRSRDIWTPQKNRRLSSFKTFYSLQCRPKQARLSETNVKALVLTFAGFLGGVAGSEQFQLIHNEF